MDAKQWSQPLREALRRYLERHPDAADSLEGIGRWWLPEVLRGTPVESLRMAIEALVDSGEMRCSTLPDGTQLYARGDHSEHDGRMHGDGG
jgi:hypothetical protein